MRAMFVTAAAGFVFASGANAQGVPSHMFGECTEGQQAKQNTLSTEFANKFWLYMGCEYYEGAVEFLRDAPKVDSDEKLPTEEDFKKRTPLSVCYYESFVYGPGFHKRNENGSLVTHGFFDIPGEMFTAIERAALAACKMKPSV